MSTSKDNIEIMPDERSFNFDKETNRYHALLYLIYNGGEYSVSISCADLNMTSLDILSFAVEFLKPVAYDPIDLPYDYDLFQAIENEAVDVFYQMKHDESSSGAV